MRRAAFGSGYQLQSMIAVPRLCINRIAFN